MTDTPPSHPSAVSPSSARVEAFSDGVFAIAITLLVLDLVVPSHAAAAEHGLAHALAEEWPSYLAYLVSFTIIGIIWVNHHTVFAKVQRVDRAALFANLLLLLTVSVLPFPTRLLAEYLTTGADSHVAAAVYSASMLVMGLSYALLWSTITRDARLLHANLDAAAIRATLRQFAVGNVFYLLTIGVSFLSAIVALGIHAALAVYYCFDQLATPDDATPDDAARDDGAGRA
jgi:uncharacterized membrane protein